MKNKNILTTIISIIVVIALSAILVEQVQNQMNSMMYMTFQVTSLAGIFALVGLLLFEENGDERTELHKKRASRLGYVLGLSAASIGLIAQSLSHKLDPWLIFVVIIMILGKLIGRIYSNIKN